MRSLFLAAAALAVIGPLAAAAQDTAEGEKIYKRLCSTCHIVAKEGPTRQGPTLFGLIGRKAGSVEGFRYSEANKKSDLVWTPEILDKYITDPRAVVPGTTMAFAGLRKADERAALIGFLQTLK